MPKYNTTAPYDANGTQFDGVYDPNSGTVVALRAGTVSTDPNHNAQTYAPIMSQIADVAGANVAAVNAQGQVLVSEQPPTTVTASATGAAAAIVTATLPGVANKTNYLTGFVATSTNPASTVSGTITITGCVGGTLSFQFVESNTFGGEMIVSFPYPIPASAVNTAITVTIPAITSGGAGGLVVTGFVQ